MSFAKDELVSDDPQNERFLIHQKFNQTVEEDEEIPMKIVNDLNRICKRSYHLQDRCKLQMAQVI